eukprot:scaffold11975_cov1241-Chaetoceros_neogracile.AAC.2
MRELKNILKILYPNSIESLSDSDYFESSRGKWSKSKLWGDLLWPSTEDQKLKVTCLGCTFITLRKNQAILLDKGRLHAFKKVVENGKSTESHQSIAWDFTHIFDGNSDDNSNSANSLLFTPYSEMAALLELKYLFCQEKHVVRKFTQDKNEKSSSTTDMTRVSEMMYHMLSDDVSFENVPPHFYPAFISKVKEDGDALRKALRSSSAPSSSVSPFPGSHLNNIDDDCKKCHFTCPNFFVCSEDVSLQLYQDEPMKNVDDEYELYCLDCFNSNASTKIKTGMHFHYKYLSPTK